MPLITAPIPDLSTQVIDPIIRQALDRIVATLGLTEIFQDNIILRTKYSGVSNSSDILNNPKLSTTRLVADINIQQNPNNVKWPVTTFHHSPAYGIGNDIHRRIPIFNDKELGFGIYEQGSPCSVAMQCNMMFHDRNIGYSAASRLVNLYSSGNVHQVEDYMYTYRIPDEILSTLGVLFKMKRFTSKHSTFLNYMGYWSGGSISVDSSRHSTNYQATVKKMTTGCLISVEYSDDEPGTEMIDSSADMFTVQFTLYLQFQLINTLYFYYPVMVENQMVPIDAIPLNKSSRYRATLGTMEMDATSEYYQSDYLTKLKQRYTQIPFYDDWVVPAGVRAGSYSQYPVLIAACSIDEDKDINTLELNDVIGDNFYLTDLTKDIIRDQEKIKPGGIFEPDSIFYMAIYYGDRLLDWTQFDFDVDTLTLKYKGRMLNKMYHFVLSEITDISKLDKKYIPLLYKYRNAFDVSVIQQLRWLVDNDKGYIFEHDFSHLHGNLITGDGNIYDINGKKIGWLNADGSWTNVDGNKHEIGYLEDVIGARHGNRIIARIFTTDIVAARKRSDGQVVTREQYEARRVR